MRNSWLLLLIPVALLLTAQASADSMRCGHQLVSSGDSRSEVRAKCGEPTDVETRTVLRRSGFDIQGRRGLNFNQDTFVEIPIEVWTYNFGPYKLMRQVQFINGRIDEILTMGYGYNSNE
jgi:hypothetical protein